MKFSTATSQTSVQERRSSPFQIYPDRHFRGGLTSPLYASRRRYAVMLVVVVVVVAVFAFLCNDVVIGFVHTLRLVCPWFLKRLDGR